MTKRVVITGMGAVTAIGHDWQTFSQNLAAKKSGIQTMEGWKKYNGLNTCLGGPITDFEIPSHYTRKQTRSMGRVSIMATRAAEVALEQAGMLGDDFLKSGNVGVSYGSSSGTPDALQDFGNFLLKEDIAGITATTYIRMMSHTTCVNLGVFFGLTGRIYTSSTACTSGSQGIGLAYEAIKSGAQTMMLAGGAEELCASQAAIFDTLFATSVKNDAPKTTPSPFDANRDGLVIGEGASTFVLEEYEHAIARGATIYAEIVGYGTNSDGGHITQPNANTMQTAMELSLASANLAPSDIGYINAHGTATDRGDIAESTATAKLFGNNVPISGLKGNLGHTLGACGAIESWASIQMMHDKTFYPTLNLQQIDENCGELDYIIDTPRNIDCEFVMNNNFAFGGINTSLIFKRV